MPVAIHYSQTELTALANVSDADVALAREMWRRYSLPIFRDLIDAPLVGTGRARIVWDAQTREYVYTSNGYHIPPLDLRNHAIEPFLNNVRFAMRFIDARLQNGEVTLIEWQQEIIRLTKFSQLAAALVANGGTRNNTQTDYALIAAIILALLLFLQKFALDIESGAQLLNGTLLSRSDLYANAGRDAYEEMRRRVMGLYTDATEERRVLDAAASHCHTDEKTGERGCVELAALGWQPIGTLPPLRSTPCRSNCRCHFVFR